MTSRVKPGRKTQQIMENEFPHQIRVLKELDKIRYEKKVRLNRPSQEIKNLIYYYEQQQKALFPRRYKKQ